jgi:putative isomerase
MKEYIDALRTYIVSGYRLMYRERGGIFPYEFLTPGSPSYGDALWDWDSYFSNVALKQILIDTNADPNEAVEYERGCILNYLSFTSSDGFMPIMIARTSNLSDIRPKNIYKENMHKPILAQHAAFIVKHDNGNAEWIRDNFDKLQFFINNYINHHRHKPTGLFYWKTDKMIGVDNDPCTFYRPDASSASIYLNCLMVKELAAMEYLSARLGKNDARNFYQLEGQKLTASIREHCYDERDGFFYNVDINLCDIDFSDDEFYHRGMPRHWDCLIQRIDVWSGFMALWAKVATPKQAKRIVKRYRDVKTFNCAFGVRTLSPFEKMYRISASNNPSCWLGPVWIISNYLTFRGLVIYGYIDDARILCEKTIRLLGKDVINCGQMHEYYSPDDGEPIINSGFQNWNMLILNMIDWYEGKDFIEEF